MDVLLKEMQEMDKFVQRPVQAPSVMSEVANISNPDALWSAPARDNETLAEVRNFRFYHAHLRLIINLFLVLAAIADIRFVSWSQSARQQRQHLGL